MEDQRKYNQVEHLIALVMSYSPESQWALQQPEMYKLFQKVATEARDEMGITPEGPLFVTQEYYVPECGCGRPETPPGPHHAMHCRRRIL